MALEHERALPLTMRLPLSAMHTDQTVPACPSNVSAHSPDSAFHKRTVLSAPPLTMRSPPSTSHNAYTRPVCPSNVTLHSPDRLSYTRTVVSPLPLAMCSRRQHPPARRHGNGLLGVGLTGQAGGEARQDRTTC